MIEDVELFDEKALYLPTEDLLVISDIHLGIRYSDAPYPKMEHKAIHRRVSDVIATVSPSKLVFNGDVFAGGVREQYFDSYWIDMFEDFDSSVDDMLFTIGNHESKSGGYPSEITENYTVQEHISVGKFHIRHGHRTPTIPSDVHIISHIHPVADGHDVLMFGDNAYYSSDVIILPKFTNILDGSEVSSGIPSGFCPIVDDGIDLTEYAVVRSY